MTCRKRDGRNKVQDNQRAKAVTHLSSRITSVCPRCRRKISTTQVATGKVVVRVPAQGTTGLCVVVHRRESLHRRAIDPLAIILSEQKSTEKNEEVIDVAEKPGVPSNAPKGIRILVADLPLHDAGSKISINHNESVGLERRNGMPTMRGTRSTLPHTHIQSCSATSLYETHQKQNPI
jgi:hypothetical protein